MSVVIDPALAAVGKDLILGNDPSSFRRKFDEWYEHHTLLAEATGVTDENQLLKLLMLWGGKDFRKFCHEAGVIATGDGADTLQNAVVKIRTKAGTHANLSMAMYNLLHHEQGTKTVCQYAREISELADQCQLDTIRYTKDRAMRDALLFGTSDNKLRRDGLAQDLSYDQLLKNALSYEQSRQAASQITTTSVPEEVNKVHSKPGRYSGRHTRPTDNTNSFPHANKCPNCPKHYRPHPINKCPAQGKTCMACRGKDHFAGSRKCPATHVKAVSLDDTEKDNDAPEYSFTYYIDIDTVKAIDTSATDTLVTIQINQQPIQLYVDSQCKRTIIPSTMMHKTLGTLTHSNTKFKPYGTHTKLTTVGEFTATMVTKAGCSLDTTIYVVDGETPTVPLLGEIDAKALGILKINKEGHAQQEEVISDVKERLETAGYQVRHDKDKPDAVTEEGKKAVQQILDKHTDVFKGIGLLKDQQIKLHIDEKVEPVVAPYRAVPLAFQEALSKHLEELRQNGKIEDVPQDAHSGWVSNVVITQKKNGTLRMNIDMREANKAIRHTPRHVETVQEMRHKMRDAKFFTEMDMGHAFHQIALSEDSRAVATFRTHEGLHRFKVLFFGAAPATDLFHERIRATLEGLEGCTNIHDNIIVWGRTEEEHTKNLDACLSRLKSKGLTLRKEKCTFLTTSVVWFGWTFSSAGMSADQNKVKAIVEAGKPSSCEDVKSFLQAVQFNAKFTFDSEEQYAKMTEPLRKMTHKHARFNWTPECNTAYENIREAISSDTALRYFDPNLPTVLITDASDVGIAATIYQKHNDTLKPVDHASRALTETEKSYSSIEKESLAQAWGMETHRYYLLGIEFESYTDHEPLVGIYSGKRKGNARLERHRIKVQGYRYTMKYLPGKTNPCDYASRHPLPLGSKLRQTKNDTLLDEGDELCISHIITEDLPDAITLEELQRATSQNLTFNKLMTAIEKGYIGNDPKLKPYKAIFSELGCAQGIIMRGDRIVIPSQLQNMVIESAHEGHQGEVKTKQLLRSKVWFPQMDKMVKEKIETCIGCQANTPYTTRDPLQPTKLPDGPWQDLAMDFKGPLPSGEYLLVVIDAYSRYPEVEIVGSTAAHKVIPKLDKIFATHGFPYTLKTDGGPPFNGTDSHDFARYMKWTGIKHKIVSPDDPEANGLAENFMKNLSKTWKIALTEKKNPQQELYKFLRHYRATPHSTTGKPPAELLYKRKYKVRLPELPAYEEDDEVRQRDQQQKLTQKWHKDKRHNVRPHQIKKGDKVLLQNQIRTGKTPWYDPDPYTVIEVQGHQITATRRGATKRRDAKKFKIIKVTPSQA